MYVVCRFYITFINLNVSFVAVGLGRLLNFVYGSSTSKGRLFWGQIENVPFCF